MIILESKTLELLSVEQQIFEMAKDAYQRDMELDNITVDSLGDGEYRLYHSSRYCVTSTEVQTEHFYEWRFDGDQFEGFVPITAEEFVRLLKTDYHNA
jgi:hypothetical protein